MSYHSRQKEHLCKNVIKKRTGSLHSWLSLLYEMSRLSLSILLYLANINDYWFFFVPDNLGKIDSRHFVLRENKGRQDRMRATEVKNNNLRNASCQKSP